MSTNNQGFHRLFEINKKRIAAAIIAAAVLLLSMGLAIAGDGAKPEYIVLSLLFSVLAVLLIFSKIHYGRIISIPLGILIPIASMLGMENYTRVWSQLEEHPVTVKIVILNLLFFYLLYALFTFLLGSFKLGFFVATLIPMLFGLTNYFVYNFRGTPIVPWDVYSMRTAVSVASNYTFSLDWKSCFSIFVFVWIILAASKSEVKVRKLKIRIPFAIAAFLCLGLYIAGMQNSAFQSFFGMDTTLFTINVFYRNNGIAAAFIGNLRFLNVEKPDGYSPDAAEEIALAYENTEAKEEDAAQYPNIIVLMNEAYSDLSVWGDFDTSEEVMPVFKSLQEECIGGELYVSVKGGNTANTEYEFLTGDSMAFLPAGSVAYQQYIKSEMPSMASYLKSLGYDTLAIHPYLATGWDRDKVYEYFGFDDFLDIHDFENPITLRGYISDQSAYEKVIEQFEEKGEEERLFVFEVTMQNHGSYSKDSPDFEPYIELTQVTSKNLQVTATEKYLSLINTTDAALKEITDYFRDQDEPTVIVMFGDHQPSDYITNEIRRICGVDEPETIEEIEQGYRVPFLVWTNYDVDNAWYDGISVNYLGGIVMEAAGIPLTDYQTYLQDLQETLPVINANAYRDASGNFYSIEDKDSYAELINQYNILDYNHLVDTKHRLNWFFGS